MSAGVRNGLAVAGSLLAVGLGMLYPTSTNRTGEQRRPGMPVAPAGIVRSQAATVLVNGTAIDTRYGLVQVQIAVRARHIVTAKAIDYPSSGSRDREINRVAIPLLQQATVTAQGARIDAVSGATFTSRGYVASLQAALDAAHLG